ncbi:mandelate racemase/muconate lactonizing enzyme family protein [Aureobasidium subglaciale]|nr:mandelate racemase/muconate lactonizing enzyme family protein [Aureobasidium subglaciale]
MAPIKSIEYFRVKPRWLFVKIVDAEGHVGWGEATLEGHTQAVEGTLLGFIDRFLGLEADDIEHIWQLAWRQSFYRGGPVFMSALAGIDIALWDLKARRLGVPIYQLLGGKVRQKVQVYAWIGGDRPSSVAEAGKERLAQGFRAVKMNATEDVGWLDSPSKLDSAVERVKTVKALGLDVAVDFHGRLHKAMAKQLARKLEGCDVLFLEEPLLSEHPEGIKQLSNLTSSPIALGERLYSRWDFKRYFEGKLPTNFYKQYQNADLKQMLLSMSFSLTFHIAEVSQRSEESPPWRRLMMVIAMAPHCPLGPIALAACLQIGLSTPNHMIQEMSVGMHYNTEAGEHDIHSYVHNPEVFAVKDGHLDAFTGPGLGIEVDEEAVRRVAENTEPWPLSKFVGVDGALREW